MKKTFFPTLGMLAMASSLLVSCMDNDYDLNNVDMTIGTSADITLPICSTSDILLKNVMDLTDDGVVQIENGEFFIVSDGSANVPDVNIDDISISKPTLTDINTTVDLDDQPFAGGRSTRAYSLPGIPDVTYTYTIEDGDETSYGYDGETSGEVPESVIEINSVTFKEYVIVNAGVTVSFGEGHDYIEKVHMDNLVVSVPAGLQVSAAQLLYVKNGTAEAVDAISIDNENGKVQFTKEDKGFLIKECDVYIRLLCSEAIEGKGGLKFDKERSKISLDGEFRIDGTFRLESTEFNTDKLTAQQEETVKNDGNYDNIRPDFVSFIGEAEFESGDIKVGTFSGKLKTNITDIAPFELNDLPDFLNEPEVVLDLDNPSFFIKVKNEMNAVATTAISLSSRYSDGTPSETRSSGEINVPASCTSVICLAEYPEKAVVPAAYEGFKVVKAKVKDLGDLLRKIPDEIDVDVADLVANMNDVPVPSNYEMSVDYMLYTPMEFGPDLNLVYEGTEEDIHEDMEDAGKIGGKEVRVVGNVYTELPLGLTVSLDILDVDGNSLKYDEVNNPEGVFTVGDIDVDPYDEDNKDSHVQPLNLTIKSVGEDGIRKMLQNMDKVVYRAVAKADKGGKLYEEAKIKLTDLKFTVIGGITYDAN